MATVYLARDLKHDRPVALKLLHAELGQVLGSERFQREIRLAARLQHPHILTVLDSGELADAATGHARPGSRCRSWTARVPPQPGSSGERQLPLADDALRIARVAHALNTRTAHRPPSRHQAREHPLTGHAIRWSRISASRGARAGAARLTETGLALGMPAYMSPEQPAAARDLDARPTSTHSPRVLYEMLAGVPPFSGATPQALLARRVGWEDAPPPVQQRPSAPEAVARAPVARALAADTGRPVRPGG